MDSFFGKNGTLQDLMSVTNSIQGMQSENAMSRASSLGSLIASILALCI